MGFNNRWMVLGFKRLKQSLIGWLMDKFVCFSDSAMRIAALPVGAASATLHNGLMVYNRVKIFATVVVFPVPGPPVMMEKLLSVPWIAAVNCQSILSGSCKLPMG